MEWKCLSLHRIKVVTMVSYEIRDFIQRLNQDIENKEIRRKFHENYEWLESYWKRKFGGNNGDQLFCNNHDEFYWQMNEIKNIAKELAIMRPVGASNNNFEPTQNILRATYFLKYRSELFEKGDIEENQEEIVHADNWNASSFKALFSIIKQIRDNLFHGRKIDLGELQYERNRVLVQIGANLTDLLLLNLIEAEENI